jgi:molecular chaperone DnaK (HSP70)
MKSTGINFFYFYRTAMVAIGIDLGTTNSVVSVWKVDKVIIIPNDEGLRVTPSIVAFTDTDMLVGDVAKHQVKL